MMLLMSLLGGPLWKAEGHDAADAAALRSSLESGSVMMLLMSLLWGPLWKAAGS